MVLQAYIDDSGLNTPPVSLLGGWYASVETWEKFSVDWQKMLDSPPSIPYFKLRELRAGKGPLSISPEARIAKEHEAMRIIAIHNLVPFVCLLSPDVFKEAVNRVGNIHCSLYHVLAYSTIMQVVDYLYSKGIKQEVDFIFDEQGGHERDITDSWYLFKQFAEAPYRKRLGRTPQFASDIDVLPIQAADAHAWFSRREGLRYIDAKEVEPDPYHLPDGAIAGITKFGFISWLVPPVLDSLIVKVSGLIEKEKRRSGRLK